MSHRLFSIWTWSVLVAFAIGSPPALASGEAQQRPAAKAPAGYTIEAVPAWVVPAKEKPDTRVDRAPLHYRVFDEQMRVDDKTVTSYHHVVRVVNDVSGLGVASQVEIEFDPSYQTLAWHHFDIVRAGKHLNKLDRKRIQLLQRETQLERRIYDGRVTASVVVDDVRVGDQLDFAYSIRGANPVFDGRYVDIVWMTSQRGPIALYQLRLLAPEGRKINVRVGSDGIVQSTPRVDRGVRETIFRRESIPQLQVDTHAPYSAVLKHQVQFSEFADWADVARWGERLFAQGPSNAAALDQKAGEIKGQSSDAEQQLLAALRFVQADVRYFGTETGLNSHRPAPPDKVLEQRFGDCKDKVGLLVALLRRLGIEASPVLVSSYMRGHADAVLPSPLAFNHVIARVDVGGKTHWLDGTRGHQSGELANRQAIGFDKGLPLAADVTALAALPNAFGEKRMEVRDIFRVTRFVDGVALESRITYRGDLAELMREALATRNVADIETQLVAPYARVYPKLKSAAPMRIENSQSDDAVTLVQSFSIDDFWRFPEQRALVADIVEWSVIEALRLPNEPNRHDPIALSYPGLYKHTSVVEFSEDVFSTPGSQRFEEGGAQFSLRGVFESNVRRSEYTTEARLLVDEVAPKDLAAYTTMLNKLAPRLATTIAVPALSLPGIDALKRELKETDDAVRAKKLKPRTRVQYQALVRLQVLSAQIAAGRLSPSLQAQALTTRGVQYDNLGRYDDAAKDFALALQLAPDVPETQNAAAVNALQLRDYARAVSISNGVLAKNADDTAARNTRALASYFSRDYAAAKADLDELLKDRAQVRRGYPLVWLSLASRQAGLDASSVTSAIADDQLPSDWPRPLVDWARGKINAEAVIAGAKAGEGAAERLCEAYFYIGERYMAEGDKSRAAEFFQKAIDQGVVEYVEDGSSRNRLAMLK